MNTYQETIAERKSMANSARRRVNGSKSRKCSLPSDNLTPAQKRKLNGPCVTYAINRPMDWETFKAMPKDLKADHISYIQTRFEVGVATIGQTVFGIAQPTLRAYLANNGIHYDAHHRSSAAKVMALRNWVNEVEEEPVIAAPTTTPECAEPEPDRNPCDATETDNKPSELVFRGISLSLLGEESAVLEAIRLAITGFGRVSVEINIKKEETA